MLSKTAARRASASGIGGGLFKSFTRLPAGCDQATPPPPRHHGTRTALYPAPGWAQHQLPIATDPRGSAIPDDPARDVVGENRQIAEILDRFGDGFVVLDSEYRVAYINRAAELHYGLDRRTAIGRVAWDQLAL